jgi:hypothetical protein
VTTPELFTFIGVTITGATLLWQIVQFSLNKNTEAKSRQFEIYHRMIKELVEPPEKGATYIDKQCAVVFELRRFKRYRALTIRILDGLKQDWKDDPRIRPRLNDEIDLTLNYLRKG